MLQPEPLTPILELKEVTKRYGRGPALTARRGNKTGFYACENASLCLMQGETLGVVGESGSGKSTIGKIALGVLYPDEGHALFMGGRIDGMGADGRLAMGRAVSAVFQDPNSSLDPKMTVSSILSEPLIIHGLFGSGSKRILEDALENVGLEKDALKKYPHQFSGGQRQRIAIARALMLEPRAVILDEPVSALDPSIQAQIINLLSDRRSKSGFASLFISHDLNLVRYFAERLIVMYRGRIVESGPSDCVGLDGSHPYSRLLFDSVPGNRAASSTEQAPAVMDEGRRGCVFANRCPSRIPRCLSEVPPAFKKGHGWLISCWLFER